MNLFEPTLKKNLLTLAACAALLAAPVAAQAAALGVDFTSAASVGSTNNTWTLGYRFTANSSTSVVALGTWNQRVQGRVQVGLWDSAQNLLASTFVDSTSDTQGNADWLFEDIPAVALTAGSDYYVGSFGVSAYAWDVNGFTVDSRISYVADAWVFDAFAFPSSSSGFTGSRTGFFGGNVMLEDRQSVPEPGVIALMGLGLAGAAVARRRRSRA